jgi:hypothetical protein
MIVISGAHLLKQLKNRYVVSFMNLFVVTKQNQIIKAIKYEVYAVLSFISVENSTIRHIIDTIAMRNANKQNQFS